MPKPEHKDKDTMNLLTYQGLSSLPSLEVAYPVKVDWERMYGDLEVDDFEQYYYQDDILQE